MLRPVTFEAIVLVSDGEPAAVDSRLNVGQGAGVGAGREAFDATLDAFGGSSVAAHGTFFLLPLISLASAGWLFLKRWCSKMNVFTGVSGLKTRVKPLQKVSNRLGSVWEG